MERGTTERKEKRAKGERYVRKAKVRQNDEEQALERRFGKGRKKREM